MIRQLCEWLAKYLPSITIPKPDGSPYLTRYFFFGADRAWGNIFLHHFHSSDMDMGTNGFGLLHSHPWWGFSFILVGGYTEERKNGDNIITRVFKPFSFNFLSSNDYHRVDLLEKDGWSLFITGSRSSKKDWFFYDRVTKEKIDWRTKIGAVA